jgi:hypothetical protein
MPYDPNLPIENTLIDAVQMRSQLTGLRDLINAVPTITAAQVVSVNTLPPGDPASVGVSISGSTLQFTFDIPAGESGPPGEVTSGQLTDAINTTAQNPSGVQPLNEGANPNYSDTQMQALINKVDELLAALIRLP